MTNSFQRPGAVISLTIKEFEQARKETSTSQEEMATKIVNNNETSISFKERKIFNRSQEFPIRNSEVSFISKRCTCI